MKQTKIAIVGYGQMGREIERQARRRGYEVTDIFDSNYPLDTSKSYSFDVAIEFTEPTQTVDNIKKLADMGKNIVVGTTGWLHEKEGVEKYITDSGTGLVWASNFSIGMQVFFRLVSRLSSIIDYEEAYDIFTHEFHHKRKKDSPGGTALSIGDRILKEVTRKHEIVTDSLQRMIEPEELHVTSTRGGEIAGTHMVIADSKADTVELTHRAKNRTGFASGSLVAADWIDGRKGFFEFGDALDRKWGLT